MDKLTKEHSQPKHFTLCYLKKSRMKTNDSIRFEHRFCIGLVLITNIRLVHIYCYFLHNNFILTLTKRNMYTC